MPLGVPKLLITTFITKHIFKKSNKPCESGKIFSSTTYVQEEHHSTKETLNCSPNNTSANKVFFMKNQKIIFCEMYQASVREEKVTFALKYIERHTKMPE